MDISSSIETPETLWRRFSTASVSTCALSASREAGVPVHTDPELADALAGLALGSEVPEDLWAAVAEALAWAYSVSDAAITPKR